MGLLGHVLGGALQGVGTGITNDAIAARQAGIEAMRQRFETQRDDIANERQTRRDEAAHGYRMDESKQGYQQRLGELAVGAKVTEQRDRTLHDQKIDEIKVTQRGQRDLAIVNANQDRQTAAYKRSLEAGDVVGEPVRGANGNFYARKRDGSLIDTGVGFAASAASEGGTGGGSLSEAEQHAALQAAQTDWRKDWIDPKTGQPKDGAPPRPDATSFIGMTHAEYRGRRSGSGASGAPAKPASGRRVLSAAMYERSVSDAMQKAAHGEKGWAGLDAAGIRARLEQIYGAQGFDLPAVK